MKKTFVFVPIVLAIAVVAPLASFAQPSASTPSAKFFTKSLKIGDRDDLVRELQAILKSDASVYPEGSTSGYFGPLTEKAVKRLQARYNLPQTGVLDEATQEIIFPSKTRVQFTILAPNGGEVWDKGRVQTISWRAIIEPTVLPAPATSSAYPPQEVPAVRPFFPYASLDLIQDNNPSFRQHIATVNFYQSQYEWKIPAWVREGSGYRVQISVGRNVPCLYGMPEPASDRANAAIICAPNYGYGFYASDTSDNPFKITGTGVISPDVVAKLREQIRQMEATITTLQQQLATMKAVLANY